MQDYPRISIIVAVKNAEADIENTILSIQKQIYPNWEFIVIDSESEDDTPLIIERYWNVITHYKCEPDSGIYEAWNKGLGMATGEWVLFLGAGDELTERALEEYVRFINNSPIKYDFVSSKVNLITSQNIIKKTWGEPWQWNRFKVSMRIAHVGSLHHKSLFEKFGLFNTSYKIAGDYEFLLRPGTSLKAGFLDKITGSMKLGGVSLTNNMVYLESIRAKNETGGRFKFYCILDAMKLFLIVKLKNLFSIA